MNLGNRAFGTVGTLFTGAKCPVFWLQLSCRVNQLSRRSQELEPSVEAIILLLARLIANDRVGNDDVPKFIADALHRASNAAEKNKARVLDVDCAGGRGSRLIVSHLRQCENNQSVALSIFQINLCAMKPAR
jgi:hypothetical protein